MNRLTTSLLLSFLVLIATVSTSSSSTWYVKLDGTGDAPTIQAAIDIAKSGDVVLVAPGQYTWANQGTTGDYGLVTFLRRVTGIKLKSESGPGVTVLNAQYMGRIMFLMAENSITVDGFTMKNGVAPLFGDNNGGGIIAHLSAPVFKNCIIRNCSGVQGGGMWFGGVSGPRFENCKFLNNSSTYGAGVFLINSSSTMTFVDCIFRNNIASLKGGGVFSYNAVTVLENCEISGNSAVQEGGGFYGQNTGSVSMISCTLSENASVLGGGIRLFDASSMTVSRSIVAFSGEGEGLSLGPGCSLTLGCSNIYGNNGGDGFPAGTVDSGGNLSVDPQFCGSPGTWNYQLQTDSYCAPGNHPGGSGCDLIGAYAIGCGGVPAENASWGRLKALYGE